MTDSRRIRRVSDAVVASYIHDISARTGRHGARADRLDHTRRALRRRDELLHVRRPASRGRDTRYDHAPSRIG